MKKTSKYAIAAGVMFILIALAWSGFSWSRIQDDLQHISRKDYKEKHKTLSAEDMDRVNIDIDNVKVVVKTQSDNDNVRVNYFATEDDKFSITETEGTLSITRTEPADPHFICFFRCISTPGKITVYVPADSAYAYDITADNAPVAFENKDTLDTKSVRITSSNSKVSIHKVRADGTVHVQSDNGSAELRDVQAAEKLTLTNSNASSTLQHVNVPAIDSHTDNGSVVLDTVTADNLTVYSQNASITLNRLVAKQNKLTSENGSVQGSLVGSKDDYAIRIGSNNGSIRLDGVKYDGSYFSDGNKSGQSLTVTSSNASVTLNFTK